MDWIYNRRARRGPEWKHGWREQTLASISTPPLHLLTIFTIVIFLLWLSQYTSHKSYLHYSSSNFQLYLFLFPLLIIIFMGFYASIGTRGFGSWLVHSGNVGGGGAGGGSPWMVVFFLVLSLTLVCHQSLFHSKWFGPLNKLD